MYYYINNKILREKIGHYLKMIRLNDKKLKKNEIKMKIKEYSVDLLAKGAITQLEYDKFLISDSWLKQLKKEYLKYKI